MIWGRGLVYCTPFTLGIQSLSPSLGLFRVSGVTGGFVVAFAAAVVVVFHEEVPAQHKQLYCTQANFNERAKPLSISTRE